MNISVEEETFIECNECHRKHHEVCVLFLKEFWLNGFRCGNCNRTAPKQFKSNSLAKSKLSDCIEENVNRFLKTESNAAKVNVRVLSNHEARSEIKSGMQRQFDSSGKDLSEFPYIAKTIFAFQELNGADLCFFGLHVQEYGTKCSAPNARRINIAYLDTIKLFDPPYLRSEIYKKIILSYLHYAKKQGFMSAHIWVSPPSKGSEYIFHRHPPDQRTLSHDILLDWYINMLEKGKEEGIICSYNNMYHEVKRESSFCLTDIPYFEGDFWPHIIEQKINSRNAIVKKRKKTLDIESQILSIIKKVQDSFIVVHLQSPEAAAKIGVSFHNFHC